VHLLLWRSQTILKLALGTINNEIHVLLSISSWPVRY